MARGIRLHCHNCLRLRKSNERSDLLFRQDLFSFDCQHFLSGCGNYRPPEHPSTGARSL